MSAQKYYRNTGIVKFARMSNQVLAGNLSRLIKDAKHSSENAHGKLQDSILAVKNFQTFMIDGHAKTDRCGKEATKDFMKVLFLNHLFEFIYILRSIIIITAISVLSNCFYSSF